jgi:DNA helicase-2/ATP-dependent DNA helicase PcrA
VGRRFYQKNMQIPPPTNEQLAIIAHPLRQHARVLAVAGSGKTTTIVLRVAHLIKELGVDPRGVRVFAYNALARNELRERIATLLTDKADQPRVDTFHSFAYRWLKQAIGEQLIEEPKEWWLDEQTDRSRLMMHRAIQSLVQEGVVEDGAVDVDAVAAAITLWKAALIPAGSDRAAHATSSDIPLVYARYEEMRLGYGAVGFDDFVPLLVQLADEHPKFWRKVTGAMRVLIVDEYQDVNFGQQLLVTKMAGTSADVMVVGDDDQTIYEWRGARPDYLLSRFGAGLADRQIVDYPLTQSFRFGPLLAQCAHNVIVRNKVRFAKDLVAADWQSTTNVQICEDRSSRAGIIDDVLCDQLVAWCSMHAPASVVVLGRTLGQLQSLEIACLLRKIPYRILGRGPFYQRREHTLLADYVATLLALDTPLNEEIATRFIRIANTPMRGLQREVLQQAVREDSAQAHTLRMMLTRLSEQAEISLLARERITDLLILFEQLGRLLRDQASGYELLSTLSQQLRLDEHFVRAYGRGEAAAERSIAVRHLIAVVEHLQISANDFCGWLAGFDATAGEADEAQQVLFTTVYRAKGLEYEHVLIPAALEGYTPAHGSSPEVFDRNDPQSVPAGSDAIEEERRLFYVAITRAKQLLTIGVPLPAAGLGRDALPSATPSRFVYEMKLAASEQILASAQTDAEALQEALAEFGVSPGMLVHLQRYLHDDAAALAVLTRFRGEIWPMRPLRPKRA